MAVCLARRCAADGWARVSESRHGDFTGEKMRTMPALGGMEVPRRYVGVGIDIYEDASFNALTAVAEVGRVGALLAGKGFSVETLENVSDGEAEDGLSRTLPVAGVAGGALWCCGPGTGNAHR